MTIPLPAAIAATGREGSAGLAFAPGNDIMRQGLAIC